MTWSLTSLHTSYILSSTHTVRTYACTHTPTHTNSHTYPRTQRNKHQHTQTHTHIRLHAERHTQTHTHTGQAVVSHHSRVRLLVRCCSLALLFDSTRLRKQLGQRSMKKRRAHKTMDITELFCPGTTWFKTNSHKHTHTHIETLTHTHTHAHAHRLFSPPM